MGIKVLPSSTATPVAGALTRRAVVAALFKRGLHMSYRTEFPDFVLDVVIPDGFEDNSWHNDVCPRFEKQLPDGNYLVIWVDFANPSEREYLNCHRFAVDLHDSDFTCLETLITSDDWHEITLFIDTF
jgi:hypothetical protein